jgi:glutamate racemase
MKIGIFDSGIGGLTVLSKLRSAIPEASYFYYGDTANVPYGTKSPARVINLSLECADRLQEQNVDLVVIACNTASSLALEEVRARLAPVPVYGVVEPGAQAVIAALEKDPTHKADPILVLATRSTVKSHAYAHALDKILHDGTHTQKTTVFEQACPLLVNLIEEGWTDHPVLHLTLKEYVSAYYAKYPRGVALLGCTHYPWIEAAFQAALPGWTIVSSAQALSQSLRKELADRLPKGTPGAAFGPKYGNVEWVFSDEDAVPAFARKLLISSFTEKL